MTRICEAPAATPPLALWLRSRGWRGIHSFIHSFVCWSIQSPTSLIQEAFMRPQLHVGMWGKCQCDPIRTQCPPVTMIGQYGKNNAH